MLSLRKRTRHLTLPLSKQTFTKHGLSTHILHVHDARFVVFSMTNNEFCSFHGLRLETLSNTGLISYLCALRSDFTLRSSITGRTLNSAQEEHNDKHAILAVAVVAFDGPVCSSTGITHLKQGYTQPKMYCEYQYNAQVSCSKYETEDIS